MKRASYILASAIILSMPLSANAFAGAVQAIGKPGTYVSPNGQCSALLKKSPKGGFLKLYLKFDRKRPVFIADDITGIAWSRSAQLIFSVSPIYGKPGLYMAICGKPIKTSTLVFPSNIDKAYTEGADYFELKSVNSNEIKFYYGADVDSINFTHFRSEQNLRIIRFQDK